MMPAYLLLGWLGILGLAAVIGGVAVLTAKAGLHRAALVVLKAAEPTLEVWARLSPVAFFVFVFWVAQLTGWQAPTPENVRKLDAEIAKSRGAD